MVEKNKEAQWYEKTKFRESSKGIITPWTPGIKETSEQKKNVDSSWGGQQPNTRPGLTGPLLLIVKGV